MATTRATVPEIAEGMLRRYSSPKIALEMAHIHSQDYVPGSRTPDSSRYAHWQAVAHEIMRQAHVDMDGRPRRRL